MEKISLEAKIRKEKAKHLKKQGKIPAILYGHKVKPQMLFVNYNDFSRVFVKVGESGILSLKIDSQEKDVLVKEVQKDPISGKYIHIDFYQIKKGEKIKATVPFVFVGEAAAVKELGGVLEKPLEEIEVECLPKDLPHEIKVDITSLKTFDHIIRIKDLKIPAEIKVLEDQEEAVALVSPPRAEEELKALEEEVVEKVEEVEGVKKEEEKVEEVEGGRGKEGAPPKTREVPPQQKQGIKTKK